MGASSSSSRAKRQGIVKSPEPPKVHITYQQGQEEQSARALGAGREDLNLIPEEKFSRDHEPRGITEVRIAVIGDRGVGKTVRFRFGLEKENWLRYLSIDTYGDVALIMNPFD